MLWIPVAFVCLMDGQCAFHYSYAEKYLYACNEVNERAAQKMRADPSVRAFDVTCVQLMVKEAGNATNEKLQPSRDGKERNGLAKGAG